MAVRSARNVEKQKKKNRRAAPRAKVTRIQGNTLAVRRRLKKMAGKARAAKKAELKSLSPCCTARGEASLLRGDRDRGGGHHRAGAAVDQAHGARAGEQPARAGRERHVGAEHDGQHAERDAARARASPAASRACRSMMLGSSAR